ncbi:MAG: hypothetical protein AB8B99_23690 [Phormidesmis sp.]
MTTTSPTSADPLLGVPRPLTRVILLSGVTGLLYYGYYKWMIQDELKAYAEAENAGIKVWSGAVCLIPFVLGIVLPLALAKFDPDVPSEFAWLGFSGVVWIYIVQFRLYREVNRLYVLEGLKPPLVCWWIIVPGLNLIVGLRQIHFLSQYWALKRGEAAPDKLVDSIPFLSNE